MSGFVRKQEATRAREVTFRCRKGMPGHRLGCQKARAVPVW